MDKIHAMQLFIRVAELESFSRAADTLGLPKGSVSRQIQALENHLGTQLLHRTTRRVQLTQDGMVYYERAKDLLSNLDELDGLFQHDPTSISGKLRVDMPVGVARNLVIPRLPAFLQQYPGIELELSSSDRLVDLIREGFDCVVRVGTLKDSGLIARTLTVNSTETYHAACLAGLGIIQVPRVGVREALRNGTLVEVLPQYRALPMPVSLLYPHRRNLSRRVHLFMEWLTGVMKDYVD